MPSRARKTSRAPRAGAVEETEEGSSAAAARAPNPSKTPFMTRLTFGVEIECLVAYTYEFGATKAPDGPQPIVIRRTPTRIRDERAVRARLAARIAGWDFAVRANNGRDDFLAAVGGKREFENTARSHVRDYHRLKEHLTWNVDDDTTVRPELVPPADGGAWRWCPVELKSPVAWAAPGAYDDVSALLSRLGREVLVRTNASCGFHVHVGHGEAQFSPHTIKAVSMLLWAADPVLGYLHDRERRQGEHCRNIRMHSRLAVGNEQQDGRSQGRGEDVMDVSYIKSDRAGQRAERMRKHQALGALKGAAAPFYANFDPEVLAPSLEGDRFYANLRQVKEEQDRHPFDARMGVDKERELDEQIFVDVSALRDQPPAWKRKRRNKRPLPGQRNRSRAAAQSLRRRRNISRGTSLPRLSLPILNQNALLRMPRRFRALSQHWRANQRRQPFSHPNTIEPDDSLAPDETYISVLDGLDRLSRTTNVTQVVSYLRSRHTEDDPARPGAFDQEAVHDRLNYNLNGYSALALHSRYTKKTIEFREPAGTLDPAWALALVHVYVRIVQVARDAPHSMLLRILRRVSAVQQDYSRWSNRAAAEHYDVLDLLHDLAVEPQILGGIEAQLLARPGPTPLSTAPPSPSVEPAEQELSPRGYAKREAFLRAVMRIKIPDSSSEPEPSPPRSKSEPRCLTSRTYRREILWDSYSDSTSRPLSPVRSAPVNPFADLWRGKEWKLNADELRYTQAWWQRLHKVDDARIRPWPQTDCSAGWLPKYADPEDPEDPEGPEDRPRTLSFRERIASIFRRESR